MTERGERWTDTREALPDNGRLTAVVGNLGHGEFRALARRTHDFSMDVFREEGEGFWWEAECISQWIYLPEPRS